MLGELGCRDTQAFFHRRKRGKGKAVSDGKLQIRSGLESQEARKGSSPNGILVDDPASIRLSDDMHGRPL